MTGHTPSQHNMSCVSCVNCHAGLRHHVVRRKGSLIPRRTVGMCAQADGLILEYGVAGQRSIMDSPHALGPFDSLRSRHCVREMQSVCRHVIEEVDLQGAVDARVGIQPAIIVQLPAAEPASESVGSVFGEVAEIWAHAPGKLPDVPSASFAHSNAFTACVRMQKMQPSATLVSAPPCAKHEAVPFVKTPACC
jgi:hypothetical protein